ncbi:MAG TPA: SAM-dependent methyltransferase, partial [Blastocatellia bacterium]|nr:SAM-dependent methyltransferase [Blastocatellia bacterium]
MTGLRTETGRVYLIGAGPGDPKLLTLRAAEALAASDVVVYDYLVNPEVLVHTRRGAELIYAGKRAG